MTNIFQLNIAPLPATAYVPFPLNPIREVSAIVGRDPDPDPDEPAYPTLPTEVDTRDGGQWETK